MKNVASHSLLRWKMIIIYQFSLPHSYTILFDGRMYFLNMGVKGLRPCSSLREVLLHIGFKHTYGTNPTPTTSNPQSQQCDRFLCPAWLPETFIDHTAVRQFLSQTQIFLPGHKFTSIIDTLQRNYHGRLFASGESVLTKKWPTQFSRLSQAIKLPVKIQSSRSLYISSVNTNVPRLRNNTGCIYYQI